MANIILYRAPTKGITPKKPEHLFLCFCFFFVFYHREVGRPVLVLTLKACACLTLTLYFTTYSPLPSHAHRCLFALTISFSFHFVHNFHVLVCWFTNSFQVRCLKMSEGSQMRTTSVKDDGGKSSKSVSQQPPVTSLLKPVALPKRANNIKKKIVADLFPFTNPRSS